MSTSIFSVVKRYLFYFFSKVKSYLVRGKRSYHAQRPKDEDQEAYPPKNHEEDDQLDLEEALHNHCIDIQIDGVAADPVEQGESSSPTSTLVEQDNNGVITTSYLEGQGSVSLLWGENVQLISDHLVDVEIGIQKLDETYNNGTESEYGEFTLMTFESDNHDDDGMSLKLCMDTGKDFEADTSNVDREIVALVKPEIRSLGPYNNTQKILLVGEGDFSFSASLAIAFGSSASNMVATSLDSLDFLLGNYKRVERHLSELTLRGCRVFHGVDTTKMARHPYLGSLLFDRIVYNFPHSGFPGRHTSREAQIKKHRELVRGFFANAKKMIKLDGEIHVTHKCNGFHWEWRIEMLAKSQGLRLLEEVPFRFQDYPGYNTKYGFGGDYNFNCNPSKSYKFVLQRGQR